MYAITDLCLKMVSVIMCVSRKFCSNIVQSEIFLGTPVLNTVNST